MHEIHVTHGNETFSTLIQIDKKLTVKCLTQIALLNVLRLNIDICKILVNLSCTVTMAKLQTSRKTTVAILCIKLILKGMAVCCNLVHLGNFFLMCLKNNYRIVLIHMYHYNDTMRKEYQLGTFRLCVRHKSSTVSCKSYVVPTDGVALIDLPDVDVLGLVYVTHK